MYVSNHNLHVSPNNTLYEYYKYNFTSYLLLSVRRKGDVCEVIKKKKLFTLFNAFVRITLSAICG